MTISTPHTDRRPATGFTLVEVLIATTLSTFVLAGVLSTFIFLTRSGFRSSGYSEMEAEMRRGLETFARDARNATDVHWNNTQSVTLTVNGAAVTYAYDGAATGATAASFYRVPGDAGSTQPRTVLIHQLDPSFAFRRYKLAQAGVTDNTAANDLETKQLQLVLRTSRANVSVVGASGSAVSTRYMLRNKVVTN
jgi:Tfp pilus assembly protein PilW